MKIRAVLAQVNKTLNKDDKPVAKTTLLRYHKIGLDKRKHVGAPPTIPMNILNTMRLHIKVQQLSKQGQASGQTIKRKLVALVMGTEHEGFCGDWAWRCVRELWPDKITSGGVSQQDIICNEWTTFTKVNGWYTCNKKTLINTGLSIDKPMTLPDGTIAEITMGENELSRIINFDEAEHPFTTQDEKGGSRSIRWGDPNLAKGSERGTRGSRHTTGIYGTNGAGGAMSPIYCYYSSAGYEENFQIKPSWIEGLPKVRGTYGCPTVETYDSFASVRKSGCTDKQLMQQIIEDVYLPLYPNFHKVVKRNNNGKLLVCPLFLKTESGQGRLVVRFSSLEFRERMQDTGVYLVLRLPNRISCTQELNQLYQEFKGKIISNTSEIFSKKLAD